MKKSSLIIVFVVSLFGCELDTARTKYIITPDGLFPYIKGNCEMGLVFNNNYIQILNEEGLPLTCEGYIKFSSISEKQNYEKDHYSK